MNDRLRQHLPLAAFSLLAALLALAQVAHQPLDVDENVFVASAALLARESSLIYRDFHYNHMPAQVLLLAAGFKFSDHLLLVARCLGATCAVAMAVTLFVTAKRTFGDVIAQRRWMLGAGIGALLLFDPLFTDEVGKAWNHDLAALACLLGFLALSRGVRAGASSRWTIAAGLCVALGITTRLTFAPTLIAFLLLIVIAPELTRTRRLRLLGCFGAALFIAALPSIWIWAQAPRAAFFGNVLYPQLNTRFHIDDETIDPVTLPARLWYVFKCLFELPGNGVVTIGFVALMIASLRPRANAQRFARSQLTCLLVLVGCLYATSFAAAPMQRQYLYAPTPFMVLAIVLCIGERRLFEHRMFFRWFAGAVALCVVTGANEYNGLALLPWPSKWVPMQVHAEGVELARQLGGDRDGDGQRRVLTLYPIFPLEGGLKIYPELATGRFGLRVGDYLSSEQRTAYKMPDVDQVETWFQSRPPDALLIVWTSRDLEEQLQKTARQNRYALTTLRPKRLLYLRPYAEHVAAAGE